MTKFIIVGVTLVLLLILFVWSKNVLLAQNESLTLGDVPTTLAPYLGYWLWQSDDGLRQEVLSIDYGGDNMFLRITKNYKIRKWFPPVNPGDLPFVSPVETWTEKNPPYRVIIISPTELYCRSIEPTYAELPFHIKLVEGGTYIEIRGKKYISSNKLDPSKIVFH